MNSYDVIVIGGGAAGFFAALSAKIHHPNKSVVILEKTTKLLTKVSVSGGGRCNVTHACFEPKKLSKFYPRGEKFLKLAFSQFAAQDMVNWLNERGVQLKTEQDGRMFPITNDSQTIINCFTQQAQKLGVKILTKSKVTSLNENNEGWKLTLEDEKTYTTKNLIIANGGSNNNANYNFLRKLNLTVNEPIASLFSFNMPNETVKKLMGIAVSNVNVRVVSTKFSYSGSLLITHWGMSGPAVLKTSAWAAEWLKQKGYKFEILVNWLGNTKEDALRTDLKNTFEVIKARDIVNKNPFGLPNRLWEFILEKSEIPFKKKWRDLSKKQMNKLINTLVNDGYKVEGKTTFKEEFVTCGGVNLSEIDSESMASKKHKGLYFAGEVMNIDGVTGGFNFQAAWTTAYIAGKLSQ